MTGDGLCVYKLSKKEAEFYAVFTGKVFVCEFTHIENF